MENKAKFNLLNKAWLRFILITILIVTLVFSPASIIFAHSPVFPEENHDLAHAYLIDTPAKSWAVYTSLDHTDKGDYYQFDISKGEKIEISLLTADSPSVSGFLPSFVLMVPGSAQTVDVPSYIEVPAGYGTIMVEGEDPGQASYEPFSPGHLYAVADFTANAPSDGTYYIAILDMSQKTGNYSLAVGYVESFTPVEFLLIPYNVHTTYVWEGQNLLVTYLPLILVIVIGGLLLYWRSRQGHPPDTLSKWLAAFAGLAFAGTTVSIIYQMFRSTSVTGLSMDVILTGIFIVIGIVLSLFSLLYALRTKASLGIGWRIGLFIIGVFALVGWSGFYLGTVLAILAAVMPPYTVARKEPSYSK